VIGTPPTVATAPSLDVAAWEPALEEAVLEEAVFEDVVFEDVDLLVGLEALGPGEAFGAVLLAGACAPATSTQPITTATAIHDAPAVRFTACTSLVF
jgi:hypothetical protein